MELKRFIIIFSISFIILQNSYSNVSFSLSPFSTNNKNIFIIEENVQIYDKNINAILKIKNNSNTKENVKFYLSLYSENNYQNSIPENLDIFHNKSKIELNINNDIESNSIIISFSMDFEPSEITEIEIKYSNHGILSTDGEYFILYNFSAKHNKTIKWILSDSLFVITGIYDSNSTYKNAFDKKKLNNILRCKEYDYVFYNISVPDEVESVRGEIEYMTYSSYINLFENNKYQKKFAIDTLFYLNNEQLSTLRNSFYAKHGYIFKNQKWKDYFNDVFIENGYEYIGNLSFSESLFNEIEKYNIELIKRIENAKEPILLSDYLE